MASIRIPYEYRSFSGAPITTAIEKRIRQNSNPLIFFSGWFFFLPLSFGFAMLGGRKETILWWIMGMCALICTLSIFLFPLIVRTFWLKKQIAEKMAYLEIKGNLDPAEKGNFRKFILKKLSIFLVAWVFCGLCCGVACLRPIVYNSRMHAAWDDGDYSESRGDKCTLLLAEENLYTTESLPVWMTANSPGQVGYILRVSPPEEFLAGYTPVYNHSTGTPSQVPVYRYACNIDWVSCATGTIVKTHRVEGAYPTIDSPMVNGAYYGSDPLESWEFERAIEDVYQELLAQS